MRMNRPNAFGQLSVAQLRLFGRMMQLRSFSAAARELAMSQPAASRTIASMESALGGALFLRTTRSVRPTALADTVLERLAPTLLELDQLELLSQALTSELTGSLRVAAPGAFGRRFIAPLVERFLSANPQVSIELLLADRRIDLVAHGVDVAVRLGAVGQRTGRTRVVGQTQGLLVAAPALLEGKVISTFVDALGLPVVMPVDSAGAVHKMLAAHAKGLKPTVRMRVDDIEVMRAAVIAGVGVAVLPSWLVGDDVRAGRLTRVLPDVVLEPAPVRLVFASGHAPRRVVRVFADMVASALRG